MTEQEKRDFRYGVNAVLNYLEGFWMGLENRSAGSAETAAHLVRRRAG
jgi:hypothetical protein